MELDIVLKGQSNAALFASLGGLTLVQEDVDNLLGYDAKTNKVDVTSYAAGGTALVPDPTFPATQSWLVGSAAGWSSGALEQGFDAQLEALPAAQKAAPTVILDMQIESDTANPSLTAQTELSAVYYDMTLTRAMLGQGAATTPVVFLDTPYPAGETYTAQAIKVAQQQLSAIPSFNSTVAAGFPDVDMSYEGGINGGPHLSANDVGIVAARVALTVADSFAGYALPGSAISSGLVDWSGPQGTQASQVSASASQVDLTVAPGTASAGLAPLGISAASGEGFSLEHADGTFTVATAAAEADPTHLLVTFGSTAVQPGDTVYYDYGNRRFSDTPNPTDTDNSGGVNQVNTGNGYGTAVYDGNGLPLGLPATGLTVGAAAVQPEALASAGGSATVSGSQITAGAGTAQSADIGFLTDARALLLADTRTAPDSASLAAVSQGLALGTSVTAMASQILSIPSPLYDHAGESSAQFVSDIMANGWGIQPPPASVATFAADIDNGSLSRGAVLGAVATSPLYTAYDHSWLAANGLA